MIVSTFNVNGVRATLKKDKSMLDYVKSPEAPDVLCLQETKLQAKDAGVLNSIPGYTVVRASFAEKKGYSGTAILVRDEIAGRFKDVTDDKLGLLPPEAATEGRVCVVKHTHNRKSVHIVCVYVPNSGVGAKSLERLPYRTDTWDPGFARFVQALGSSTVVCGDMNVAHTECDIARPKPNVNHAGFTELEREGMTSLLRTAKLTDAWRAMHPDVCDGYSWWSLMGKARANNVGWRIDYVLVSTKLMTHVQAATIHKDVMGSDHCPVSVELTGF